MLFCVSLSYSQKDTLELRAQRLKNLIILPPSPVSFKEMETSAAIHHHLDRPLYHRTRVDVDRFRDGIKIKIPITPESENIVAAEIATACQRMQSVAAFETAGRHTPVAQAIKLPRRYLQKHQQRHAQARNMLYALSSPSLFFKKDPACHSHKEESSIYMSDGVICEAQTGDATSRQGRRLVTSCHDLSMTS